MSFDTDSLRACFSKKTDQTRVSQIDLDYHAPLRVKGSFINKKNVPNYRAKNTLSCLAVTNVFSPIIRCNNVYNLIYQTHYY